MLPFLAFLFLARALIGQVAETVTVEVVDVPVYVIGPDKKPITGLTKDAFEIFEDGKRVPLEYFTVLDFAVASNHSGVSERKQRRLSVLLFDYTFKRTRIAAKIARSQKAAESLIDAGDPSTDFFAIATYTSTRGVFFVTPFLSDRNTLQRALHDLRASKRRADSLGLRIGSDEGTAADVLGQPADRAEAEMLEMVRGGAAMQGMQHDEYARIVESQFAGLGELADRLAALDGQKHVVLFTEGFDGNVVYENHGQPDGRVLEDLKAMHRRFQAAGVMLDSVDITGIENGASTSHRDALVMVSRESGGQVIENSNDLADALTEMTRSQQIVYLLGLRRRDTRAHRITVRVNGVPRGSGVFYREGYGAPQKSRNLDALNLADIIINDQSQNGFGADVALDPVDGATQVTVSFKQAEVLPQLAGEKGRVIEYIYVFNSDGSAVASAEKYVDIDRSRPSASIESHQTFALPPGNYAAKVLLRIDGTDSLAFVRRDFAVP